MQHCGKLFFFLFFQFIDEVRELAWPLAPRGEFFFILLTQLETEPIDSEVAKCGA